MFSLKEGLYVLLLLVVSLLTYISYTFDYFPISRNKILTLESNSTSFKPIILAWTRFFSRNITTAFGKRLANKCPYKCILTEDRSDLLSSAAVVFHLRSIYFNDLPLNRTEDQLYVFLLNESPHHTYPSFNIFPDGYFNLTMTYRHDSDLKFLYGKAREITKSTPKEELWNWDEIVASVRRKDASVLWFVSNCKTPSKREEYAKQLRKYINITQYGWCNSVACSKECAIEELDRHFFYLAFENSVCRDYTTEKAFSSLEKVIVPIVLKRSIAEKNLPNGSFIAVDDFKSPKYLAKYLLSLQTNESEYIKYFEWKKRYQKSLRHVGVFCDLCKLLYNETIEPRSVHNLTYWWFDEGECEWGFASKYLEKV